MRKKKVRSKFNEWALFGKNELDRCDGRMKKKFRNGQEQQENKKEAGKNQYNTNRKMSRNNTCHRLPPLGAEQRASKVNK